MTSGKRKPRGLYFTDVVRIDKGGVGLIGHFHAADEKDEQKTVFLIYRKGNWSEVEVNGICHALRFTGNPDDPARQYLLLERNRALYRFNPPTNTTFERIFPKRHGFLMDMRKIEDKWYVVGGHHQIYVEDTGVWKAIDDGVYLPGTKGEDQILLSVHGLRRNSIYTVGMDGIILHYDGKIWNQIDSPTNTGLQRVLCVSEDEVYLCGNANGVYRGNANAWSPLTEPEDDVTFWDIALFKDHLYFCTKKQLYVLRGDSLEEVQIPVKGPLGFYRMDADKDELWTCGNDCLLQYDGKTWTRHIFPGNE
jgi:hypothetical protein